MNSLRFAVIPLALVVSLSGCASNAIAGGGAGTQTAASNSPAATSTPTATPQPASTVTPNPTAPKAKVSVKCGSSVMTKSFKKSGLKLSQGIKESVTMLPGSARSISAENKGLQCSWDTGDGHFGAWWTTVDTSAWKAAEQQFLKAGSAVTEVPGITTDVLYFLQDDHWQGTGHAFWTLDALHGSTWIRLTSTNWTTPADGVAAFKSALKVAKLRG